LNSTDNYKLKKIHGRRLLTKLGRYHLALIDERDRLETAYNNKIEKLKANGLPIDDVDVVVYPLKVGGDPEFYSEEYPKLISRINKFLGTNYSAAIEPISLRTLSTPAVLVQYSPIIDELGILVMKVAQHMSENANDTDADIEPNRKKHKQVVANIYNSKVLRWSEVTFEKIMEDRIKIIHKQFRSETYYFSDIGFGEIRSKGSQTQAWKMLMEILEQGKDVILTNRETRSKIGKPLSRLRIKLRDLTGIDEDPFPWIRNEGLWEVGFKIKKPWEDDMSEVGEDIY
jgi:hypothetical protein